MERQSSTISRRELLKRGALVGGATLWATPVVQAVGMGRAFAKDVSPDCRRFCMKWETDDNEQTAELTCKLGGEDPIWTNVWEELGERRDDGDGGTILTCPDDGTNDNDAANRFANRRGYEFVVYGSPESGFWVAFPQDVKFADLNDEGLGSLAVKCGRDSQGWAQGKIIVEEDLCFSDPTGKPYTRVFIPNCDGRREISHFELIVDWCPEDLSG